MKKVVYSIENKRVFCNIYDTKYKVILNFYAIYRGNTKKDCEAWLKKYKKENGGKKCIKLKILKN